MWWLAWVALASESPSESVEESVGWVLTDVRVADALGERHVDALAVLDGRIVHVGDSVPEHGSWPTVDGGGTTVVPGLVDAHVHLSMTPGGAFAGLTREQDLDLWRHHLAAYVACGVVAVLDTGILLEDAEVIRELAAEGPSPTVRFLGPLVSPPGGYVHAVLPSFPPATDAATLVAQLEAFDPLEPIGVKVTMEDGMVRPIWPMLDPALREVLKEQHRPLMVHAMDRHEYEAGIELGAAAFVHPPGEVDDALVASLADTPVVSTLSVMDTMLHPAQPERLDDPLVQLVVPALELEAAADPAVVKQSYLEVTKAVVPRLPGFMRGMVITMMASARPVEKRLSELQASVKTLHDAGVPIVAGSDSGNWPVFLWEFHGPTTVREVELLQDAGLTPAEALRASTLAGAELLGLDDELGTIEVGKRASFIVVEGDPLADVSALRTARAVVLDGVLKTPAEWMGR